MTAGEKFETGRKTAFFATALILCCAATASSAVPAADPALAEAVLAAKAPPASKARAKAEESVEARPAANQTSTTEGVTISAGSESAGAQHDWGGDATAGPRTSPAGDEGAKQGRGGTASGGPASASPAEAGARAAAISKAPLGGAARGSAGATISDRPVRPERISGKAPAPLEGSAGAQTDGGKTAKKAPAPPEERKNTTGGADSIQAKRQRAEAQNTTEAGQKRNPEKKQADPKRRKTASANPGGEKTVKAEGAAEAERKGKNKSGKEPVPSSRAQQRAEADLEAAPAKKEGRTALKRRQAQTLAKEKRRRPRQQRTQRFLKMKDRLLFGKPKRGAGRQTEAGSSKRAKGGETASSKAQATDKTQKTDKAQKTGVRILKIKKGGLFFKLSLKEKDIVSKLNEQPVRNLQSLTKRLEGKTASFQLTIFRKGRTLILSYKASKNPESGARVYQLISSREKKAPTKKSPAEAEKTQSVKEGPLQQKPAKKKPVKTPVKKQPLKKKVSLLKKHKRLLQKAYVLHLGGGIIYEKPSFDSQQMFVVPFGKEAVISKKILRPDAEIGSFYKIFIKEPKKTAGYISEIDILPQYIKNQGAYVLNPEYKLWQKSGNKDAFMQNRSYGKNNLKSASAEEPALEDGGSGGARPARLVGMALGAPLSSETPLKERLRFGLQLSGHDLLIPRLNMDIRFMFDSKWDDLSVEVMGNGLFLSAGAFKAGPGGGLRSHVQFQNQEIRMDAAAGLSGLLPLAEPLILRGDLFWTGFFHKPKSIYFLSALQWRF